MDHLTDEMTDTDADADDGCDIRETIISHGEEHSHLMAWFR